MHEKVAMKMQRQSRLLLENKGQRLEALLENRLKPKHIGAIVKRGKIFTVKLSSLGGPADIKYSSLQISRGRFLFIQK